MRIRICSVLGLMATLVSASCGGDDNTTSPLDGAAPSEPDASADAAPLDGGLDAAAAAPPVCDASSAPVIPPLRLEAVPGVGSLRRLVDAEQPKGSSDWYLVQQTGTVRLLRGGTLLPGNFLDVSDQTALGTGGVGEAEDERGLLGIAFPPDYATSGKLYIALTPTSGTYANQDTVLEFARSTDGLTASATGKVLLRLPPSSANHNGGNLQFGPDGYLYFGTGDGGGLCNSDERGAPQDVSSKFGKILRLDPNASAPDYAAPNNPFAGMGDPAVLHYGLRNPFRFGFDRANGDLYIGDVGQDSFEEISYAAANQRGLNFGWPRFEGAHEGTCLGAVGLRAGSTHTPPIVDLPQNTGIWGDYVSVIGGVVYRGRSLSGLQGVYLFGDYQGARMGAVYHCADGTTSPATPIAKVKDPNQVGQAGFTRGMGLARFESLTAILEDDEGELYFVINRDTLVKVVPGG